MNKSPLEFPIPEDAIKVTPFARSQTDQTMIARVIEMPDGQFIAQDSRSSLGFPTFEAAVTFLATFNM